MLPFARTRARGCQDAVRHTSASGQLWLRLWLSDHVPILGDGTILESSGFSSSNQANCCAN